MMRVYNTGMRRPSWNKSQAIQQVISLKALLETTSDSNSAPVAAAGEQEKLRIPASPAPKHVRFLALFNFISCLCFSHL